MKACKGSLTAVGTGIRLGQMTPEVRLAVQRSQIVFSLAEPATDAYLATLCRKTRSLLDLYVEGKDRWATYQEMIDTVLAELRRGQRVCFALYGHPGVFAYPAHESIRRARAEGYEANMLPGVSAEDCLFADLGIDPADCGCLSYEATDFMIYRRQWDRTSYLVLWQIGLVGEPAFHSHYENVGLGLIYSRLAKKYPAHHEVVLYEASPYPMFQATITRLPLGDLWSVQPGPMSTLFVPPSSRRTPDRSFLKAVGYVR